MCHPQGRTRRGASRRAAASAAVGQTPPADRRRPAGRGPVLALQAQHAALVRSVVSSCGPEGAEQLRPHAGDPGRASSSSARHPGSRGVRASQPTEPLKQHFITSHALSRSIGAHTALASTPRPRHDRDEQDREVQGRRGGTDSTDVTLADPSDDDARRDCRGSGVSLLAGCGIHHRIASRVRRRAERGRSPTVACVERSALPGPRRHSIEARFAPDSGVCHTPGSATRKRLPLVVVGTIRMNRPLSPACHG